MKAAHLTLFALWLALLPPVSAADAPLLIEGRPATCQPLQPGPGLKEGLELCIRQAELGHANAQYIMGNYWYEGELVEQDFQQAMHWYEQASLQGHAGAQYRLGMMFAAGEGVAVNRSQAYIILKMSAINGSDLAFDASDRLDALMSKEERQQANDVLSHIFRRYLRQIQEQGLQDDSGSLFPR